MIILYFTQKTHCFIILHIKNKNMDILIRFGMNFGLLTLLFISFCPKSINGCSYNGAREITTKSHNETFTSKFDDNGDDTKKDDHKRIFDKEKYGKPHKFVCSILL